MVTVLTSKFSFVQSLFKKQHQNMVREIIRPLSISPKLNSVVTEKQEENGVLDTYERAISALNSLQSNASTIAESVALRKHNVVSTRVQEAEKYMKRSGLDYNNLDRLSVIHVAGTKGKVSVGIDSLSKSTKTISFQGTTCAITESILRSCGFKTGFFSSPHLIHATERIRINGQPVSKDLFTKYFWKVYRNLDKKKVSPSSGRN